MNTTVAVVASAKAAATTAQAIFALYERTLSRFLPDSPLSQFNAAAGRGWRHADPLLLRAVAAALFWARRYPGLFDPTVLPAVTAAGYDRSFERVPRERPAATGPGPAPPPGPDAVDLDLAGGRLRLAAGTAMDLGGIGKGLAVDAAIAAGVALAPEGILINAGGDIASAGSAPDGPWRVGIPDPLHPERDLTTVVLTPPHTALATSSTQKRRWRVGGEVRHHLIDPRTGAPAVTRVVQCTAVAPTAEAAEVLAKVLMIDDLHDADALVARCPGPAAALAVLNDGRSVPVGAWPREWRVHA